MSRSKKDLGELLLGALARPELVRHAKAWNVLENWNSIVGEKFAQVSAPKKYEKGRLQVAVVSPSWLQEIGLSSNALLAKLNAAGEGALFTKIRFVVGELPHRQEREERKPYEPVPIDVKFETPELREIGTKVLGKLKAASEREED